jgi:Microsomal signal peptidase 25 kDa subunit (SPC25)
MVRMNKQQAITTFVEQDTIMVTKPKQGANQIYKLHIRTNFPRFQDEFGISIAVVDDTDFAKQQQKASKANKKVKPQETKLKVGGFFDVEGYYDEPGLIIKVQELIGAATAAAAATQQHTKDS